jgi:uncharacterized protein (DUF58 family)
MGGPQQTPAPQQDEELAELLAEVRRIDVQASRLVNNLMAGGYTSVFRGAGLEFEGVREYEEGDDPRSVDWNVTARVGRPFVKTMRDERELTVLFLLDLSPSMSSGFGAYSARQAAARVCACLALAASRNNDKVGLIAFGEEVLKFVPPKKGSGHVLRIIRDCLALPPATGETRIEPALDYAVKIVRRRAVLFLVSDFLTEGWRPALSLCARRHDVIAVRILNPELAGPLHPGILRLRDPETGVERTVNWSSRRERSAYERRVAAWRDETEHALGRAGVDRMDVPVSKVRDPEMVTRPILKFFQMRQERGAKR